MLRTLALLLVLLNSAYLAWSEGWLGFYGLAPVQRNEPQREHQQIRPEAMLLLESDASSAARAARAPLQDPAEAAAPPAPVAPGVSARP